MARKSELAPTHVKLSSNEIPHWSLRAASTSFGVPVETLRRKLSAAGESPDSDNLYLTSQILSSLYSDERTQRLRRITEEADNLALKNAILRGSYLDRCELTEAVQAVFAAIAQIIEGNARLTSEEKSEVKQNLASIKVRIDEVHKAQTHASLKDEMANPVKRPGRKRKAEEDEE